MPARKSSTVTKSAPQTRTYTLSKVSEHGKVVKYADLSSQAVERVGRYGINFYCPKEALVEPFPATITLTVGIVS